MVNMLLSGDSSGMSQLTLMILMFGAMYFLLIAPNRKKDKRQSEMRAKLEVGDEVVTEGGVIGLVTSIREDTVVIETGSDRCKIRVARWAIRDNLSQPDSKK